MTERNTQSTAADGKTELVSVQGHPLLVSAVEFNRMVAQRDELLEALQRIAAMSHEEKFAALDMLAAAPEAPQPAKREPVAAWENKYGMKEWEVHALRAGWMPASPQPRKRLTDEEIKAFAMEAFDSSWDADDETLVNKYGHGVYLWRFVDFTRAVERAHGIGGEV